MPKNKLHIPRGEAYDVDIAEYHEAEEGQSYHKLHAVMRERKFTLSETKTSSRVLSHWEDRGLLPDGCIGDGWRKFTLVELVWLRAITHLRSYGLSLERIAQIKDAVMDWRSRRDTYYIFEYYLVRASVTSDDPYILVLPDGRAGIATSQNIEVLKMLKEIEGDMLLISLKGLLRELGYPAAKPEALVSLSASEMEVLQKLRLNPGKEIKLKTKEGVLAEIESVETHPNPLSANEVAKAINANGGFGEVVTKYSNGKKQSVEVRSRKRLK